MDRKTQKISKKTLRYQVFTIKDCWKSLKSPNHSKIRIVFLEELSELLFTISYCFHFFGRVYSKITQKLFHNLDLLKVPPPKKEKHMDFPNLPPPMNNMLIGVIACNNINFILATWGQTQRSAALAVRAAANMFPTGKDNHHRRDKPMLYH